MAKTTVLVVDDDKALRDLCLEVASELDFEGQGAEDATCALRILETTQIDIVLSDVRMPEISGIELLKIIRQEHPEVAVVMMTGFGTIPQAVEAVKLGAYDYITKPFKIDDLRHLLGRVVEKQQLRAENRLLKEQHKSQHGFGSLVGSSATMQGVYELIVKAAGRRYPVLIMGESGTGKELVARAIHSQGPWCDKPFVPVDCGALTVSLIDSELFGHVRGAFTGATQSRPGLLAQAKGGTLFLDEVAELPVEVQSRLLRSLQEREIRPVGANERTPLDARVVAATNKDLEKAVPAGTFRGDLYFRLNVVPIRIPPLRERKSDIPVLVQFFLQKHGGPLDGITGVSAEALSRLMAYDWPGNVRELENCVQRAVSLGGPPLIQLKDLPTNLLYPIDDPNSNALQDVERHAILRALQTAGGDCVRAAKLVGIGKTTIYRKLRKYGLELEGADPKT
jgi:two-component system, NtrC family, response regulator AtoC